MGYAFSFYMGGSTYHLPTSHLKIEELEDNFQMKLQNQIAIVTGGGSDPDSHRLISWDFSSEPKPVAWVYTNETQQWKQYRFS